MIQSLGILLWPRLRTSGWVGIDIGRPMSKWWGKRFISETNTLPGTNMEVENGPLEDHEIHYKQVVPSM